jgi:integrase
MGVSRSTEALARRCETMVDRSGPHHLWLGATNPARGTGRLKVNGAQTTAHRVAWELARGELPAAARVLSCPENPACVRLEHLSVEGLEEPPTERPRARKGTGSMRRLRPRTWELRVTVGRWNDGQPRTLYRSVTADTESEAGAQLRSFVEQMSAAQQPETRELRDLSVDEAIERFLADHLGADKGRADKTISDYRRLHRRWFSPTIGQRRVNRVDAATMDRLFGAMRQAGLSRSRLNQAKSLYAPFFRWAKRRGMTERDPMADFEVPISTYRSKERTPPEVEELSLLLSTAVEVVPDIAPLLVLGAVTGMRRGELVGIRRSAVAWDKSRITVDSAVSESGRVKGTKTRVQRRFHVDSETIAMLRAHSERMAERASAAGVDLCSDPFLFSAAADCSTPLPPDAFTKRVGVLKGHLGIENKRPEVAAMEDEALRLRRQVPGPRPVGMTGPTPKGGLSLRDIGQTLGRSERWAALAVEAAERREQARKAGRRPLDFDGSIIALRKFTLSELLDAGFNVSMVAQRQGHGPQVLTRHYSKSRASADKKAAEHLGRVVHGSA